MGKLNTEICIDDILKKIKIEVNKRQLNYEDRDDFLEVEFPNYKNFHKKNLLEKKDSYTAGELVSFNDEDFITVVYNVLLKRDPDSVGFNNCLASLRNFSKNKIEILWETKNSTEGKKYNVWVKNLKKEYYKNKIKRILMDKIPVLRYFVRLFIAFIKLPTIAKNIHIVEYNLYKKVSDNENKISSYFENTRINFSDKLNVMRTKINEDSKKIKQFEEELSKLSKKLENLNK
ncbi:MAG: hypothetical protein A2086_16795 [Spirochaetes bacterium GWD1_27_9]|nr:MAG: hypothetical protein A2Z98_01925 [Spirochaetes bacterium GWB1_27_13]OHD24997.1 MAG: hypothetical protein A2Y34_13530 [Spirochaetes bacterium GWC1_27_15]OHD43442.1 MAG: hypothetical protein A2086_16795 [Spirochaetes bacterium GWD1_27_9]